MADLYTRAKEMFPNATDEEITTGIQKVKQEAPEASDDEILKVASAIQAKQQDGSLAKDMVKQSLRQKYGLDDKYSDASRQKIVDANAADDGFNWSAFGAGMGQALAGGDVVGATKSVLDRDKAKKQGKLDQFDKGRSKALEDFETDQKFSAAEKAESLAARESDAASEESKLAQSLASKLLPSKDFSTMSAAQINKALPGLQKMYEMEQKKLESSQKQANADRDFGLKEKELQAKKDAADRKASSSVSPSGKPLTAGQKKVDEDYAKHYNDFSGQGASNAKNTIDELKRFKAELEEESKDTFQSGGGRIGSMLPDSLRTDQSLVWKKDIPAKANLVLKKLFGGQLSDDERKSESATYYDDMLGPEENAKKLESKIKQLEQGYQNESRKAKYYEKYGTLQGFTGQEGSSEKPSGKVKVSNGKETFEIDAEDLADAEADGYKRI